MALDSTASLETFLNFNCMPASQVRPSSFSFRNYRSVI